MLDVMIAVLLLVFTGSLAGLTVAVVRLVWAIAYHRAAQADSVLRHAGLLDAPFARDRDDE